MSFQSLINFPFLLILELLSATLRRGFAFSSSINSSSISSKNPPLHKTRNVTSQSFNLAQQQLSAAAGSGPTSTAQQQPPTSHIQQSSSNNSTSTSDVTPANRPDIENVRSET